MAAYAALASLMNLIEDIQIHPPLFTSLDNKQLQSLSENLVFLLDFVENCIPHWRGKEAEDLESRIASEVHAAEDVIESHVVDLILSGSTAGEESSSQKNEDVKSHLQTAMDAMDSIKKSILEMEIEPEREFRDELPEYSATRSPASSSTTTVGLDDESIQLLERLIQPESCRQIIPIVGMGGTGKTTLARLVYEHSLIVHHFDIRVWATISQQYRIESILSELLFGENNLTSKTVNELGENLHKKLWGRRYLIILDDMWSLEIWNEIQLFLPDNGNGGRIVVTTRLSNIAAYLSSFPFEMKFLDEEKSWRLFCAKAFGEEDCPPGLQKIGKDIVRKCKGLALSIVVIGGHLGKSSKMKGYWESVGNDINSVLDSGEDQCLGILSLSYNHLPAHLKPFFLYLGVFNENKQIYASQLIDLWVAEGLLKPNQDKSKEEIGEDYLKDLVDRNLILVHSRDRIGQYKYYKVHDLLRELSIKVAKKENFFCVLDTTQTIDRERRVILQNTIPEEKHDPEPFHAPCRLALVVRSLRCEGGDQLSSNFRLLRVLINKVEVVLNGRFLELDFQLVNLRYLRCRFVPPTNGSERNPMPRQSLYLPPSISRIWNLQALEISGSYGKIVAPSEIWKMTQLRRLDVGLIRLPDPPCRNVADREDYPVLENLHTLGKVENLSLSEDVCKRIPNIKELDLYYDFEIKECDEGSLYYCLHNLGYFNKLESLRCGFYVKPNLYHFARSLTFPSSLKKLHLRNIPLCWDDLTVIASLPHLVDLNLFDSAYGAEWNLSELGFPCLKSLKIYGCRQLVSWDVNSSHFPVLECLHLQYAYKLDEIPSAIGDIPTLQFITLHHCSESAGISAARILVEQEELGNDGLRVEVKFNNKEKLESFREMVLEEGLSCSNLLLQLSTRG